MYLSYYAFVVAALSRVHLPISGPRCCRPPAEACCLGSTFHASPLPPVRDPSPLRAPAACALPGRALQKSPDLCDASPLPSSVSIIDAWRCRPRSVHIHHDVLFRIQPIVPRCVHCVSSSTLLLIQPLEVVDILLGQCQAVVCVLDLLC